MQTSTSIHINCSEEVKQDESNKFISKLLTNKAVAKMIFFLVILSHFPHLILIPCFKYQREEFLIQRFHVIWLV